MQVIHVVPGITEEASGPSYSVLRLCHALIESGEQVTLATVDWGGRRTMPEFVRAFPLGFGPRRIGRSPALARWLAHQTATGNVGVIHSHGMWQMSAVYPGWETNGSQTKLVISPRGAFSAWAMSHGSFVKKAFWPLVQRPALNHAACFHATADTEYEDIRRLGFNLPVAIISNGIDVPAAEPKSVGDSRQLLFLGRVHPKKGLDILLKAWAAVMDRYPDWHLSVVGTSVGYGMQERYLEEMKMLAMHLQLRRVDFRGPLYGESKWSAYRNADLFVLPTHSENFALTVAEALAAGTPAIVSKGAPWQGLDAHACGWWIDVGVEPLVACLEQALVASSEDLGRMGAAGREWMSRDFAWREIAVKMARTYRWLLDGGPPPAWVKVD